MHTRKILAGAVLLALGLTGCAASTTQADGAPAADVPAATDTPAATDAPAAPAAPAAADAPAATDAPAAAAAAPAATPVAPTITYRVTGNGTASLIDYNDALGHFSASSVPLPWSATRPIQSGGWVDIELGVYLGSGGTATSVSCEIDGPDGNAVSTVTNASGAGAFCGGNVHR